MEWSDIVCEVAAIVYDMTERMEWMTIQLEPDIYVECNGCGMEMEWEYVKECVWRNGFKYFK